MRLGRVFLLLLAAAVISAVYFYGVPPGLPFAGGEQEAKDRERPPTPVVLAQAQSATITLTAESVGDVVARDAVTVSPKVTGRVTEVLFSDGERVETNQILVRLDPAEAMAAVEAAEARASELRQGLDRAEELAESGAGPQATADDRQQQVEGAESQVASARERLEDYNIRAPFAGRLGLRNISVGALVQPGAEIATLDTIDPIEVRFAVPERFLGQIKPDAPVAVATPAFPGEQFTGEVLAIGNRVDPALRTVNIEAEVPNPDGRLLPGMLMNVTVDLGTREDAVVVPPLAVRLQGANHFVFTIENNKAKRIDVEVGQRDPDKVEIVKGLEVGTAVVVQAPQDLNSGQAIQEAREGEQPPPEGAAASAPPPQS